MKKIVMATLIFAFVSMPVLANQKERMVRLPDSFNAFLDAAQGQTNPDFTHLTCRLENRNIGTLFAVNPLRKLMKVDNVYFMPFTLSDEVADDFDRYSFDTSCWSSTPEGFNCTTIFNPGEFVVDCH